MSWSRIGHRTGTGWIYLEDGGKDGIYGSCTSPETITWSASTVPSVDSMSSREVDGDNWLAGSGGKHDGCDVR